MQESPLLSSFIPVTIDNDRSGLVIDGVFAINFFRRGNEFGTSTRVRITLDNGLHVSDLLQEVNPTLIGEYSSFARALPTSEEIIYVGPYGLQVTESNDQFTRLRINHPNPLKPLTLRRIFPAEMPKDMVGDKSILNDPERYIEGSPF